MESKPTFLVVSVLALFVCTVAKSSGCESKADNVLLTQQVSGALLTAWGVFDEAESSSKPPVGALQTIRASAVANSSLQQLQDVSKLMALTLDDFTPSSVSARVRNVYVNSHFKYPNFVTATHALVTFSTGGVGLIGRWFFTGKAVVYPNLHTWMYGVIPIGISFALSLSLANMGLLYTNAHFYEMLGASGFLVTAFVGWLMGKSFHRSLIYPMLGITVGAVTLALGSLQMSLIGGGMILSAVVFRAIKAQLQSSLMGEGTPMTMLDPLELTVATSIVIFLIMSIWSLVAEGLAPWSECLEPTTIVALLLAASNAAVINIACLFVIKSVGPVAQQAIGQLKGVLCCIGSVAAFHEDITYQQILGYSIVVCGILWYNSTDMAIKATVKT